MEDGGVVHRDREKRGGEDLHGKIKSSVLAMLSSCKDLLSHREQLGGNTKARVPGIMPIVST